MKHAYSRTRAKQLIPLLQSISAEIEDRTLAARRLERKLRSFGEDSTDPAVFDVRAELAEQRRQLRLSRTELEDLGCSVDEEDPRRVLIPGLGGTMVNGFCWELGDTTVLRLGESKQAA